MRFLLCQSPPAAKVDFLDMTNVLKRRGNQKRRLLSGEDSVQGILVGVESYCSQGRVRDRALPAQSYDGFSGDNREGAEGPRWVTQEAAMPPPQGEIEPNIVASSESDAEAAGLAIESVATVDDPQHESFHIGERGPPLIATTSMRLH